MTRRRMPWWKALAVCVVVWSLSGCDLALDPYRASMQALCIALWGAVPVEQGGTAVGEAGLNEGLAKAAEVHANFSRVAPPEKYRALVDHADLVKRLRPTREHSRNRARICDTFESTLSTSGP